MEDYKIYFKKFQIAILIFVVSIVAFGFIVSKIVPEVQRIIEIQNEHKSQTSNLDDMERRLQSLKDSVEAKKIENANMVKQFFKPINGGTDTESAISDEFAEILQLIRENKIKTRSINYDYDPQDDNFVKNVPDKYHVCRITTDMVANYSNFESFMRDLYKHEHFLELQKIEISPYQRNKKVLLINLQIKLYAQKDPSLATPKPAPAAQAAENPMNPEIPANPEQMPDIEMKK